MKIEMGESLFYSRLRHVKECQLVQTNWKASPQWTLRHEDALQRLMTDADEYFFDKYAYRIFKQNHTLSQLIQQGECDVIGQSVLGDGRIDTYAIDVAFHEAGLNYGKHIDTVMRVVIKCIRTAICLYGYLDAPLASVIFASPKINPAEMAALGPCMKEVEVLLRRHGLDYDVRLIANSDFDALVLQPILIASDDVSDTAELFLRSYQMYKMFARKKVDRITQARKPRIANNPICEENTGEHAKAYQELKIGKLAQIVLRQLLVSGCASEDEIKHMQTAEYSKQYFGLNYPLLVKADSDYDAVRYYKQPLYINATSYLMCSQWYEVPANNDRPFLMRWIALHEPDTDEKAE